MTGEGTPVSRETAEASGTTAMRRTGMVRLESMGLARSRDRVYAVYDAGEVISGMRVRKRRTLRQKPAPIDIRRDELRRADLLAREAGYVDLFEKAVGVPVRRDLAMLTEGNPDIDGVEYAPDSGNFSATVVTQKRVERNAERIYKSLTPRRREGVVQRKPVVTVVFDSTFLESRSGRISQTQVVNAVRNMLVDEYGVRRKDAEKSVRRGYQYQVVDKDKVDDYIRQGIRVDGVSTTVSTRVEVDAVDPHRAIQVRKPRRIKERLAKVRRERKEEELIIKQHLQESDELPVPPENPGYASV
jgi:hypothetical protein